jgi:uncharacterized protein YecT (DUF1311 family)
MFERVGHYIQGANGTMKSYLRLSSLSRLLMLYAVAVSTHAGECTKETSDVLRQECKTKEIHEADSKLNEIYRQLNAQLVTDKSAHKGLQTAERAWIRFRDASCAFEAEHLGSDKGWLSAALKEYSRSECIYRMTKQRTIELGTYTNAILEKKGIKSSADGLLHSEPRPAPRIEIKQDGYTLSCVQVPNAAP